MSSPSASSLQHNDERLRDALAAHNAGDLVEAERLYMELLKEARPQPRILQNLSVLSFQRRDMLGAERWAREALKIAPKAANAWNNLAIALKGQARLEEAVDALKKCVANDPRHHEAWSNLADLLRRAGRLKTRAAAPSATGGAAPLASNAAENPPGSGDAAGDWSKTVAARTRTVSASSAANASTAWRTAS
ncbi:MAG: tetratricopeptide repeat protein [Pseudomonadota bacterium]